MEVTEGLQRSYLAKNLTEEEIRLIAKITREVEYPDLGEVVHQHDRGCDLFIVLSGRVCVYSSTGDMITRLKEGAVFGEVSLLDKRPRSATVTCEGPARLAVVSADELTRLIHENPEMGVKLLTTVGTILCERLRSANQQIEALLIAL